MSGEKDGGFVSALLCFLSFTTNCTFTARCTVKKEEKKTLATIAKMLDKKLETFESVLDRKLGRSSKGLTI